MLAGAVGGDIEEDANEGENVDFGLNLRVGFPSDITKFRFGLKRLGFPLHLGEDILICANRSSCQPNRLILGTNCETGDGILPGR